MSALFAILTPAYLNMKVKANKNICIANLKEIDQAKSIWSIDNTVLPGEPVRMDELVPDYIKKDPVCPAGGFYTVGTLEEIPTCTIEEHVLGEGKN